MIPIPPAYLNCSVYIYNTKEHAKDGSFTGGSGFLVGVPLEKNVDASQTYVVTAKHVIENMANPVLRVNLEQGGCEPLVTNRARWKDHETDDLSVFPIDLDSKTYKIRCAFISEFVNAERNAWLYPGDEVFMIGRFFSHEGKEENSPSVRFGNISMLATETMENKWGKDQQTFLVEQRSLPGYSGSPVFVFLDPSQPRPPIWIVASNRIGRVDIKRTGPWLLGIDWVHVNDYEPVLDGRNATSKRVKPEAWVKSHTGMAGVIPAWRLAELLMDEELVVHRKSEDTRITQEKKASNFLDHESADIPVPTPDQIMREIGKANRNKS